MLSNQECSYCPQIVSSLNPVCLNCPMQTLHDCYDGIKDCQQITSKILVFLNSAPEIPGVSKEARLSAGKVVTSSKESINQAKVALKELIDRRKVHDQMFDDGAHSLVVSAENLSKVSLGKLTESESIELAKLLSKLSHK